MNNEKLNSREKYNLFVAIIFFTLLVGGTFVGGAYYNIPVSVFMVISLISATVLLRIGKFLFKEEPRPLPEPSIENKMSGALAVNAILSFIVAIMVLISGLKILDYLEKNGRQPSPSDGIILLSVVAVIFFTVFIKIRLVIIKRYYS